MPTLARPASAGTTRTPRAGVDTRRWRRLLLLAHVLGSIAWMTCALALLALLALGATSADPTETAAAARMAHHLDVVLLAPAANAAVFTGLVLALATPWGLAAHRWVLAKVVLTVVQMVAGIALLSGWLTATAEAGAPASTAQLVAPLVMAAVLAFQVWLSLAKPGGRTRWGRAGDGTPRRLPTAPGWLFAVAVAAVVVDLAIAVVVAGPLPVAQIAVLLLVAVVRVRATRVPS